MGAANSPPSIFDHRAKRSSVQLNNTKGKDKGYKLESSGLESFKALNSLIENMGAQQSNLVLEP